MSEASKRAALGAYKHLLRATLVAFHGDHRVLVAAREQVRTGFENDRSMILGSEEAKARITHAEDVAKILRHNVVQGEKREDMPEEDRYKMRIHADTERGDNESNRIKNKTNLGSTKWSAVSNSSRTVP